MDISGNKFYEVMYLYGNEKKMENEASDKKKDIKRGVQDGIPIALGYLSVSFAFGIMAVSAGLTPWQAILISVSYIGWIAGTAFGALLGGILPAVISDALGIAIYGMFLAIILPAARDDSRFLKVIIIAVVLSCMFRWIPVLNKVSSGFVIIICAVAASAVGAWLYPIDEEEGN